MKKTDRKEAFAQAAWELMEALQTEKQMESALSMCLAVMQKNIGFGDGFIWLLNRGTDRLFIVCCTSGQDVTGTTIGKEQGVVGHVFGTAESMLLKAAIPDDSPLYGSDEATGVKVTNQLVIPLKTPGGVPFGCIQMINKEDGFDQDEQKFAENLVALVSLDIEDKGFELKRGNERTPIISLRGVTKDFASGDSTLHVLKGIDLDIYPEEFLVILGESGCGKTTMMNIIGGMDELTEGTLTIEGKEFSHPGDKELTEYRRDYIGFIFQAYHLMPNLSALENLQFIAEISKEPSSPEESLALVGLSERAGNFPAQMSGGQQQRVSIARALTKNPKLILADEPTAALDFETSIEVLAIVEDIVRNHGKTVVMITHNPEIAKMADRVVKLRGGMISSIRINLNPLPARELSW